MSVQMVLPPVLVLVGLTFFLLLWMATARTRALGDVDLLRAADAAADLSVCALFSNRKS